MFTVEDLDALLAPHGLSSHDVPVGGLRFARQSRGWSKGVLLLEVETFVKVDGKRIVGEDGVNALTERRYFQVASVGELTPMEYVTTS